MLAKSRNLQDIHCYQRRKRQKCYPHTILSHSNDLLDVLGSETSLAKLGTGKGSDRLLLELAVATTLESNKTGGTVLVTGKDVLGGGTEADHARQEAARGDTVGKCKGAALGDGEVGDGVGVVAREAVGNIEVLVVGCQNDLASSSLLGVLGGLVLAVGGDGLALCEGEGVLLVGNLVDDGSVGQLTANDVVSGLFSSARVEDAMTGTTASSDLVVRGNLPGVVLGVNDDNRVGSKVVHSKVTARGVQDRLVGVGSSLSLRVGAELSGRLDGLDELEAALFRVPDVDGAIAIGGANKTRLGLVELEVNDAIAALLTLSLLGELITLEVDLKEAEVVRVLVDGIQEVWGGKGHPRVSALNLLLEGELELARVGVEVGDVDVARVAEEDARRELLGGGVGSAGGVGEGRDGGGESGREAKDGELHGG